MRWEISVGNAFSGSVAGRAWSCDDICSVVLKALRLGEVAREVDRDDGLEPALERAGVPGRDTCSLVSDIARQLLKRTHNVDEVVVAAILYVGSCESLV